MNRRFFFFFLPSRKAFLVLVLSLFSFVFFSFLLIMLFSGNFCVFVSCCMITIISWCPFKSMFSKFHLNFLARYPSVLSFTVLLSFLSSFLFLLLYFLFYHFYHFISIISYLLSLLFLHSKSGKTKSIILYLTHLYLECRSSTHKPPTHRTWSRATLPSNGTFGSMWNQGGAC